MVDLGDREAEIGEVPAFGKRTLEFALHLGKLAFGHVDLIGRRPPGGGINAGGSPAPRSKESLALRHGTDRPGSMIPLRWHRRRVTP